jgi:NADH-quinone oxidoreductase subunit N
MPFAAISLGVFLFSLAGIPPLAGFIGKFYLFAAIIKEGGFWYILLAIIGILNSVVALFYYVRILREMYLREMAEAGTPNSNWVNQSVLAVAALAVLILGIYWEPLRNLVSGASTALSMF